MNNMKTHLLVLTMATLSACASIEEVGPGNFTYNKKVLVSLGQGWTALPRNGQTDMQSLTVDGTALNVVLFADEIKNGDSLIYVRGREKIVPKYYSDMSALEISEFIGDSLQFIGYKDVSISNLQPQEFGEGNGIRFNLSANTESGLNLSGIVKAGQQKEELVLILYIAPTEYYYGLHEAEVESILNSARIIS